MNPQFFYSRRIGRAPYGEWPDNDYADVPEGVHILGAAKVTGKLAGKWNVGMLHAVTKHYYLNKLISEKVHRAEVRNSPMVESGI